ncbi:BtrH N-terminal domain-containing protein, partial [Neobacillus fumarioli]|uniref:BtrH N-terminal domain-containing protein n=1 Tax=Neobacillus fumarioli TaxID=105229 RepID=UPI000837182C
FKWNHGKDLNWEMVKHYLDHNIPILMLTDTYYLDFYEIKVHNFAGHTLVFIGYDEENDTAYVSDNINDSIIATSLDLLIRSMSEAKAPFFKKYVWSPVLPFSKPNSVKDVVIRSMLDTSEKMFNTPSSSMGLKAIKRIEHEIVFWPDLPNWQECCINVYRSLELIGTGGAGFRNLYTLFIEEATLILPFLKEINSLINMIGIADTYNNLSKKFYLAGRKDETKYLGTAE